MQIISEVNRYLTLVKTATSTDFTLNLSDETWYMFCFVLPQNVTSFSLEAESRLTGWEREMTIRNSKCWFAEGREDLGKWVSQK